jgi:Zn-dependent protease
MMRPPAPASCPQCAAQLAPTMLACPRCAWLVHGERLTALAGEARQAEERVELSTALAAWREALDLLPSSSKQHQVIAAKITELGHSLPAGAVPIESSGSQSPALKLAAGAGALGLLAWKLKAILLGLTKSTTLLSMLLSLGVYWSVWGWKFALGLVLSIYVHEMGHVIALRRYGFKATAPMFIPGLGALIRLQQQVVNPYEDAVIGLAGPIYGLGAAVVSLLLWLATGEAIFAATAGVGAWINLFNLMPIGTLDGGRGFHALSRPQKLIAALTVAGAGWLAQDGLFLLLAIVCFGRVIGDKPNNSTSWKTALTYCLLVVLLTAISTVRLQPEQLEPQLDPPQEKAALRQVIPRQRDVYTQIADSASGAVALL